MTYLLKFLSPPDRHDHRDEFYFVRLGAEWPHDPTHFLIARTTPDPVKARQFSSIAEAQRFHSLAGGPPGWEVIEYKP